MKKADKAALLQQFASLAGLAPEEITAQITALNPALSEKDVKELVAELSKPAPPAAPPAGNGDGNPPPPPPPGSEAPAPENKNRTYEEFRVEPTYKKHEKSRSNPNAWNELTGFTKILKNKDVAITPERAALLNEQSESSLVRYYDKETGIAASETAETK